MGDAPNQAAKFDGLLVRVRPDFELSEQPLGEAGGEIHGLPLLGEVIGLSRIPGRIPRLSAAEFVVKAHFLVFEVNNELGRSPRNVWRADVRLQQICGASGYHALKKFHVLCCLGKVGLVPRRKVVARADALLKERVNLWPRNLPHEIGGENEVKGEEFGGAKEGEAILRKGLAPLPILIDIEFHVLDPVLELDQPRVEVVRGF
jgi:hypothetical protein